MVRNLKNCGIWVGNSVQNANKGFDSNKLRRVIHREKMFANIVQTNVMEKETRDEESAYSIKKFTDNDLSMSVTLHGWTASEHSWSGLIRYIHHGWIDIYFNKSLNELNINTTRWNLRGQNLLEARPIMLLFTVTDPVIEGAEFDSL